MKYELPLVSKVLIIYIIQQFNKMLSDNSTKKDGREEDKVFEKKYSSKIKIGNKLKNIFS